MALQPFVDASIAIISVLIFVLNFSVYFLMYHNKCLRTYSNGFICSLALSDLLTGTVILPLFLINANTEVLQYLISIILLSGVANLCVVTYDRYVAVTAPLQHSSKIAENFVKILTITWFVPIVYSLLPLIWGAEKALHVHKIYVFVELIAGILVPFLLIMVAYVKIFLVIRKKCIRNSNTFSGKCRELQRRKREMKRMFSEAKVAKIFAVLTLLLFLSWTPVLYMTAVQELGRPNLIPASLPLISLYTIALGSLVNPLLYSLTKPDVQGALRNLLCRHKPDVLISHLSRDKETTFNMSHNHIFRSTV